MLSYMIPVEEKPPPGPNNRGNFQLSLSQHHHHHHQHQNENGHSTNNNASEMMTTTMMVLNNGKSIQKTSPISKETSVSSFVDSSDATASHSSMTPTSTITISSTDKGKTKFSVNGGKQHQSLKRVSFGSSKGSMVETLIFESPVQEEPEPSPIPENGISSINGCDKEDEREKVRVTFFQQSKPQEVDLPDDPTFCDNEFVNMSSPILKNDSNFIPYNRTESTDSGWDNPFRPGGDLSREADQIVELIKGGKPITPTPGQAPDLPTSDVNYSISGDSVVDAVSLKKVSALTGASSNQSKTNGTTEKSPTPGQVDVQRTTIKADGDAAQVEHVVIKKKKGCHCCVIS